jgi:hypothetical protein
VVPNPPGAVVELCDHLGNQLPSTLNSLHDRVTEPESPLVHAWGSPAVVLRCGVSRPAGYSPAASPTTAVDGVRWFQQVGPKIVTWTAIRRGPGGRGATYLSLAVPTHYQAADGFLVELADPIKSALQ